MSIQELLRRKQRSTIFPPRRYMGLVITIFAMGVVLCIFSASTSKVSAAQSANTGGDPNHGREVFEKRCTGCHALDGEKEGPRLRGVFGRKAGSVSSFKYSDALKAANITWDGGSLDRWLTNPDKFIPDNDMDFHLEKADERNDVIAYLRRLSSQ